MIQLEPQTDADNRWCCIVLWTLELSGVHGEVNQPQCVQTQSFFVFL